MHIRVAQGVVILPDDAPTVWTGATEMRGSRDVPPDWVDEFLANDRPLSIAEALVTPERIVELRTVGRRPPPMIAGRDGLIKLDPSVLRAGLTVDTGLEQTNSGLIETANVQGSPYAAATASIDPTVADAISLPKIDDRARQLAPPLLAPPPRQRPRSLRVTARPAGSARVVIILTAVGVNKEASRRALRALPPEIAMAVAPIAEAPEQWIKAARRSGRIVLAEIPMETEARRAKAPTPLTLRADAAPTANLANLEKTLALLPGVDGVATYLGDKFTARGDALKPVMAALKARDLFVVETAPGPLSQLQDVAIELDIPSAASVVSLDKLGRAGDISDGLALLEEEARRTGRAIGVAVAIPSTVRALADWAEKAPGRGIELTPLRL